MAIAAGAALALAFAALPRTGWAGVDDACGSGNRTCSAVEPHVPADAEDVGFLQIHRSQEMLMQSDVINLTLPSGGVWSALEFIDGVNKCVLSHSLELLRPALWMVPQKGGVLALSCLVYAIEAPSDRKAMLPVTPNNYDTTSVKANFYSHCMFQPNGAPWIHTKANGQVVKTKPGTPASFSDLATDPAALNRKNGGYSLVHFPSLKGNKKTCGLSPTCGKTPKIAAYYFKSPKPKQPTIVMIHGLGTEANCIHGIAESSWYRNNIGYNVLALDLRNHGHSQFTNGYRSFGQPEALDVLAAVRCISKGPACHPDVQQTDLNMIGLHGLSAGGMQAYQVFALEPKLRGLFVDAGVWDFKKEFIFQAMGTLKKLTPKPVLDLESAFSSTLTVAVGKLWGYDEAWAPMTLFKSHDKNQRRVFLSTMTTDTFVPPGDQQEAAAVYLKSKGYLVETLEVPPPPSAGRPFSKLQTGISGKTCGTTHHCQEKFVDPKLFIEFMRDFWKSVFV